GPICEWRLSADSGREREARAGSAPKPKPILPTARRRRSSGPMRGSCRVAAFFVSWFLILVLGESAPPLREYAYHALEMRAHRLPCQFRVARHQGAEDALMVFRRCLAQSLRMKMLFGLFPDRAARLVPHGNHGGMQH